MKEQRLIATVAADNLAVLLGVIYDQALTVDQVRAHVPEPATSTLSLLALAGLCARRRRK